MSAIIPNITSYSTPDPNPPPYAFGLHDLSELELVGAATDAPPHEHVVATTNETTNAVFVTRQLENILPFQCEVCNISCDTKDVLEKHKQGKKHLKRMKRLADLSANPPNMVPPPVASETVVEELENKKQRLLKNGATAETLLSCDVCNVICNNQEGFQQHVASKKHAAKSVIQLASTNAVFDATSDSSGGGSQKKLVGFPCEICKIVCTSGELLNTHIAGKKHLKKLKELGQIPNLPLAAIASQDTPPVVNPESNEGNTVNLHGAIPSNVPPAPIALQDTQPTEPMANQESIEDKTGDLTEAKMSNLPLTPISSQDAPPTNPMANPESTEDKTDNLTGAISSNLPVVNLESNEGKTVNSHGANWVCELCGISCNTEEVLNIHLTGKKHRKNLEKSEKLIGPNPAETTKVIGPLQENGERIGSKRKGKKGGGNDDVETKKQRVLQSGTASDALQICNLCNVVCNSEKAFFTHLAGQKHVAMAVKQAETQASAAGQES
ncbi:putative transcription factor C2H2 family [Helianthus annuus]|uniref:Putative zinc finger, U1-type, Zinc finger C2H2-type/integrase DNA-binding domain protein n=1 Tax=Helianthus annuus TaxID=4232 RepID=A0A251USJ5_HELAN|nr:zinc finger protein 346 [Helianthus annuus]KAF5807267.1 putative transcription factor C2H2 family [Helianthus annuus]KAJ0585779.1 putative transcription factor C2H2 family [Helianthus annuus]KAJ0920410.1 putative transcription factor C2H2 family [Helianthus annuus]